MGHAHRIGRLKRSPMLWTEMNCVKWHQVQAEDTARRFIFQQPYFRNWDTADGAPEPTLNGAFKFEPGNYRI